MIGVAESGDFNPYVIHINNSSSAPNELMSERMCIWFELELIRSAGQGAGVITLDQFIPLKRGTVFFRRPGDIVRGISPYSYCGILFDPRYDPALAPYYALGSDSLNGKTDLGFLRNLYRDDRRSFSFLDEIPSVVHLTDCSPLEAVMEGLERYGDPADPVCQFHLKSALYRALLVLRERILAERANGESLPATVLQAQHYMQAHYDKPITLELLSREVSLSREYFCRLFTRYVGTTPLSYLNRLRIVRACRLLVTGTETIENVSAACGFSNANYFYSVFRKHEGCTPAQYRQQHRKGGPRP